MEYINFDSSKEYDLLLLGRVAIDFNPVDYYKPLSQSTTFKKYLGGSPANIAVGMARLGKKIGFIAKVSEDQFGDFVTDYFRREGIDTSHIFRCTNGEKLGLTFTEILSETQSSILMYRNMAADLQLSLGDIEEAYIKKAKALLISGTALAAAPSRDAAIKALILARKNRVPVIFDIDYRAYTWGSEEETAIYYSMVAKESDILLGSREEFDLTEKLIFKEHSDEKTARYFHSCGCRIVVVKHGKEGSTAYTDDGKHYSIRPFPVKLLKSFGGGDGYASAFLTGLIDGKDIMDCLEMGSASAAMLVASHACSENMPTEAELYKFIGDKKKEYGDMVAGL